MKIHRTFESVVTQLREGLENGTIALRESEQSESSPKLQPGLEPAQVRMVQRAIVSRAALAKTLLQRWIFDTEEAIYIDDLPHLLLSGGSFRSSGPTTPADFVNPAVDFGEIKIEDDRGNLL
jgi:hypothetical protein